ncbi:cytochrome P450 [Xylariaceae sp. FL0662B]|nr:cytochrome P450 [Xylariaceae sp. FL0662B]
MAVFIIAFATVGLYVFYRWLLPKPLPGIAYNPEATESLFGDASSMTRELSSTGEFSMWLAKQVEKMKSPICQVFVRPFSLPWILIGDFREAEDILMRRPEFEKPQFLIDAMQGLGDFHARYKTDEAFRHRRHLRQDLMTPSFLNNIMGPFTYSEGSKLIQLLEMKMNLANGRPFAILSDYWHSALDVMTYYAFGENLSDSAMDPQMELISDMNLSTVPYGHADEPVAFPEAPLSGFLVAVQEAPHVLEKTSVSYIPKLSFWWWQHQAWFKKIFLHKDRVLPQQLRKALENYRTGKVKTALDHIMMREDIAAEKQGREPHFIFSDVLSGHHTTGGAMGWVTKYLTGYPRAQSKLRDALYSAVPKAVAEKRMPTFDELRRARVPYLEAVIEETRRLTPFSIVRETTQETVVLGCRVPKGCQVFMINAGPGFLSPSVPVDDSMRSPTSKAARLPDGNVEFNGAAGPQIAFGMGIRQCWGRRMAHLAVRIIVAMVVWNFELLEIPEELGGYSGYDGISRQPQKAFVRLRKVAP